MRFLQLLFRRKTTANIPPMPPWENIVELMYDRALDFGSAEVVTVIYSADRSMRYVILKNEKNLFYWQLEKISPYDEEEWKYISSDEGTLPAMWTQVGRLGRQSFFKHIEDLLKELKTEPEYLQYF